MPSVLIANRGEIACRIIRACNKLGWRSIAVYSDADENGLHRQLADESHPIGAAKASASYLNSARIIEVACESGADFIHPGYGFLAENAQFAQEISDAGIGWIGPSPQSIMDMGDKNKARQLAQKAGVPVVPGSEILSDADDEELMAQAEKIGYPLLVKASAGGGGIGMKRVDEPQYLAEVVKSTKELSARAFGSGEFFLERHVSAARHIEVQVFGFGDGEALHLFERDCSVQRRYQKIIEESPAPDLPQHTRMEMADAAVALARAQRYNGAGTVEFIYEADSGAYYFLEMNTRIQVEHPVTEEVTGADLVEMQLRQAAGEDLHQCCNDVQQSGHAIECRLYAENPAKKFLPSPGTLDLLEFPSDIPGMRIECGVRSGDKITPYYDPMIAKIIARGKDRTAAIEKMRAILSATKVEGINTNLSFLLNCLAHPRFTKNAPLTDFVTEFMSELTQ